MAIKPQKTPVLKTQLHSVGNLVRQKSSVSASKGWNMGLSLDKEPHQEQFEKEESTARTDYGFEETCPTTKNGRAPRRSSMKKTAGSGSRTRRRSTISFCEQVEVTPIVPAFELAKKKGSLWWQSEDYQRILRKSHEIVAKKDVEKRCTRGLENFLKQKTERYNSFDAVLDEQCYQREHGLYNEEAMSSIYQQSCVNSQKEATLRALQDAKEADKYLSDTRLLCRRMSV